MPYPTYVDDYRNDIAATLADRAKPFGEADTSLGKAMAVLPQGMQNAPTQMPTGMPQTPAGGVPGSGMAPAGASTVQLPPQARGAGLSGQMPPMSQRGMMPPPAQGMPQPLGMPQGMPTMQNMGVDDNGMMPPVSRGGGRIY